MDDNNLWENIISDMFKPLLETGISEIEESLSNINSNKKRTTELGSFLLHHLILEQYIERYIVSIYPEITRINGHKTTFAKKLEIIKKLNTFNKDSYSALIAINKVRNNLAHNFNEMNIPDDQLKAIMFIVKKWDKNNKIQSMLEKMSNLATVEICIYFLLIELLTNTELHKTQKNIEIEFIRQKDLIIKKLLTE